MYIESTGGEDWNMRVHIEIGGVFSAEGEIFVSTNAVTIFSFVFNTSQANDP